MWVLVATLEEHYNLARLEKYLNFLVVSVFFLARDICTRGGSRDSLAQDGRIWNISAF